jgi:hypothetical protein
MDQTMYPMLANHCRWLGLRRMAGGGPPIVSGELIMRAISGRPSVVMEAVAKKAERLPGYRERAKGAACWLVIHSDGYPLSSCIAPRDVPKLCHLARLELDSRGAHFDRAYWLNMDSLAGKERLHRI